MTILNQKGPKSIRDVFQGLHSSAGKKAIAHAVAHHRTVVQHAKGAIIEAGKRDAALLFPEVPAEAFPGFLIILITSFTISLVIATAICFTIMYNRPAYPKHKAITLWLMCSIMGTLALLPMTVIALLQIIAMPALFAVERILGRRFRSLEWVYVWYPLALVQWLKPEDNRRDEESSIYGARLQPARGRLPNSRYIRSRSPDPLPLYSLTRLPTYDSQKSDTGANPRTTTVNSASIDRTLPNAPPPVYLH
ncbi:hypothetical protein BJ170DRAFT_265384 [Xylariales sp. AK1849]|nr:hypothetical protein BJ170DRAFT_265384 [Xylariales sp. AK1849]